MIELCHRKIVCRNCFHTCSSKELYERHFVSRFNNEPALIQMPKPEENNIKVTNIQGRWFAPIVIYFDLESLIQPVSGCLQDGEKATTIEIHKACRFCLVGVEHGNPTPVLVQVDRSEDCMRKLVVALK